MAQVCNAECKLEESPSAPFRNVGHALGFYNAHNPARAKYFYIIEPERGEQEFYTDYCGHAPSDLWASITLGIKKVLADCNSTEVFVFAARNFGDRQSQLSIDDIAKKIGQSRRNVWRILNRIYDRLDSELKRRDLIAKDAKQW